MPLRKLPGRLDSGFPKKRFGSRSALEQMAGNLDDETAGGVGPIHESPDEDVRTQVRQLLGRDPNAITLVRNVDPS